MGEVVGDTRRWTDASRGPDWMDHRLTSSLPLRLGPDAPVLFRGDQAGDSISVRYRRATAARNHSGPTTPNGSTRASTSRIIDAAATRAWSTTRSG